MTPNLQVGIQCLVEFVFVRSPLLRGSKRIDSHTFCVLQHLAECSRCWLGFRFLSVLHFYKSNINTHSIGVLGILWVRAMHKTAAPHDLELSMPVQQHNIQNMAVGSGKDSHRPHVLCSGCQGAKCTCRSNGPQSC